MFLELEKLGESANSYATERAAKILFFSFQSYNAMMHEIFHALGVSHEHQRADRDNYLNVDFSDVDQEQMVNFDLETAPLFTLLDTVYDYSSIMHYPSRVNILNT